MRTNVAHLIHRFFLARLEWLIRGWFFAAGCWFTVGVVWVFANSPELAADLIAKVGTL